MNNVEKNLPPFNFQNYTILIVDDNPFNVSMISDYLEMCNFQVMVADNGKSALKVAKSAQPDIILLDVMMPELDGFEVCRRLKAYKTTQDIPVIFMTALTSAEDKVKGFAAGGVDYVTKPFQYEEVLARLTTHLRLRELTQQLELKVQERTHKLALTNKQLNQEIFERKRAEKALKASSEQLKGMVDERTKELQDAQQQLFRQEKLIVLGQLANGVGQELRSPLGVISNAVYFLQMTLSKADTMTTEYLEIISDRIREAEKIVSDLLNLSLSLPGAKETITISVLINEVLEQYPPLELITVTTQIAPDLPSVSINPQQIKLVLSHLILNAYQSMPKGGKLTLSARVESNYIHLSITDTGSGIPLEIIGQIFEPLFTTKAKGIGLGLAVSKNLIELHQGSIEVKSIASQGTIFIITLPVEEFA